MTSSPVFCGPAAQSARYAGGAKCAAHACDCVVLEHAELVALCEQKQQVLGLALVVQRRQRARMRRETKGATHTAGRYNSMTDMRP